MKLCTTYLANSISKPATDQSRNWTLGVVSAVFVPDYDMIHTLRFYYTEPCRYEEKYIDYIYHEVGQTFLITVDSRDTRVHFLNNVCT